MLSEYLEIVQRDTAALKLRHPAFLLSPNPHLAYQPDEVVQMIEQADADGHASCGIDAEQDQVLGTPELGSSEFSAEAREAWELMDETVDLQQEEAEEMGEDDPMLFSVLDSLELAKRYRADMKRVVLQTYGRSM